jgi:hypothetical protein
MQTETSKFHMSGAPLGQIPFTYLPRCRIFSAKHSRLNQIDTQEVIFSISQTSRSSLIEQNPDFAKAAAVENK